VFLRFEISDGYRVGVVLDRAAHPASCILRQAFVVEDGDAGGWCKEEIADGAALMARAANLGCRSFFVN